MDSRPWFCVEGRCPSFVGTIITKADWAHMSPPYAKRIYTGDRRITEKRERLLR